MNVCIIGDNLTSLSLAKILINKKINVDICHKTNRSTLSSNRTIGISTNNFEFYEKEIQKIDKKYTWGINEIEIFSEKLKKKRILSFQRNNKNLFLLVKNEELYKLLKKNLLKNKYFKKKIIKNDSFYKLVLHKKKYDLVINCEKKNYINKKYFSKTINKDYNNLAYTTIFKHDLIKNNKAIQVFTNLGPIAFLPISKTETSVVYSVNMKNQNFDEKKIIELIKKYNFQYSIKKFYKISKFELKLSSLRNYYYKNILAFGDSIHKIHPLAGQGFNMTIRDIKVISEIIQKKIDLGVQLDLSICKEFENKKKHTNFIFSNSIDLVYEIFNLDRQIKNKFFNQTIKFLGNKKIFNNMFIKYADQGLIF
jgi:2-octaprenyl-6-methoxyphenol hydroxylase